MVELEKFAYLEALEEKTGLPHIHGWPWYDWAWEFYQSRNQYAFLSAANQISKSSTLIRLVIEWGTNQRLWPELWSLPPRQFWHCMPSKDLFTAEVEKKWIPEFLPKNRYRMDPYYGWELEKKNKIITALHFKSGVTIYLKSYNQDVQDLASGTVHLVSFDEELPVDAPAEDLFTELSFRIERFDGYMRGVFTPTIGQDFWRRVLQPDSAKEELLPDAYKRQVSMYECQKYMDGSIAPWNLTKIKRAEAKCPTEAAVARRIHGRFVQDSNLKYPSFSRANNVITGHPLPKSWHIYCGIDYGSGGTDGHPPAIVFVGANPDFTQARAFAGWLGDDGSVYDAKAVIDKYRDLKNRWSLDVTEAFYDYHCKDLHTIAAQLGESLTPAEKGHDIGETILNTLFKNQMLMVYDYEELAPLIVQLTNVKKIADKRQAIDDMVDCLRYAVAKLPWGFDSIGLAVELKPKEEEDDAQTRRRLHAEAENPHKLWDAQDECEAWQELIDPEDPYNS